MEVTVLIASLLANLVTKWFKPSEDEMDYDIDPESRKTIIRVINAVLGIVALLVTSAVMDTPLDTSSLQGLFETIVAVGVTFLTSQGAYLINKK